MQASLDKIVRIGTVSIGERAASIFCRIQFKDGRLSISGAEGPLRNGNCIGGCGQIVLGLLDQQDRITPAPGWDRAMIAGFFAVWDRWHLNDLQAGSPDQEAYLRSHPMKWEYPQSHYVMASNNLREVGLNPDPNYMHEGNPYSYGSAWLHMDVPADVLAFLAALPDADITPAWV